LIRTERSTVGVLQVGAERRIVSETAVPRVSFSAARVRRKRQAGAARAPDASAPEADHASRTRTAPVRSRTAASRASAWE